METIVKLYSSHQNEINRFLNAFFSREAILMQNSKNDNGNKSSLLEWQKKYQNPIEITDIIGTFIENNDKFKINMWISLDKNVFINVTDSNADKIIRYMYERYPW